MKIIACAAGLCLSTLAYAQSTQPSPEPPLQEAPKEEKAEKPPKEPKEKPPIEINGRVIAQMRLTSADDSFDVGDWIGELQLVSGRVEVNYNWKDRLRATLEVETADGNVELRDVFLRLDVNPNFRVRAGNFKVAFSGMQLVSRLKIPLTDRGLLNDVLVDVYGIADRRPGIQGEFRKGIIFMDAGIWQGDTLETLGDGGGWRAATRGGIAWKNDNCEGEIGLGVEIRSVRPTPFDPVEDEAAVELDAIWERQIGTGALELWGELVLGSTEVSADGDGAIFFAGRAIAAWRFGGNKRNTWYAEPYGGFQFLDSDNEIRNDLTWELAFGVNAGIWREWRAQLGMIVRRVGDQAPPGLGGDGQPLPERNTLVAGLGMEF
jgi:hypothetical protein